MSGKYYIEFSLPGTHGDRYGGQAELKEAKTDAEALDQAPKLWNSLTTQGNPWGRCKPRLLKIEQVECVFE